MIYSLILTDISKSDEFTWDLPTSEALRALLRLGGDSRRVFNRVMQWVMRYREGALQAEELNLVRSEIGALGTIFLYEDPAEFDDAVQEVLSETIHCDEFIRWPTEK